MILQILLLFLSFLILYFGAEFTLSSAEKIGKYFGIPSLIVGLLIIGFGTSLPELFVSQLSTFRGHSEIALGNIVGSNISNIFLILGISALFVTFKVTERKLYTQFIMHFLVTLLLAAVLSFSKFYFLSSLALVLFFFAYLYIIWKGMKERQRERADTKIGFVVILKLLLGFFSLYYGGEILVGAGSALGRMAGISEYVISAILIAFGTSLPELITSIIACVKKYDTDVIIGNVIGSNIFNVAFVLGSLGVYQFDINQTFYVEFSLLFTVAVGFIAMAKMKVEIGKGVGVLFLATYLSMCIYWVKFA